MARIDEQRKILEAKLKEMAEDGVAKCTPRATIAYDPPDEEEEETAEALTPAHEERGTAKETGRKRHWRPDTACLVLRWTTTAPFTCNSSASVRKPPLR